MAIRVATNTSSHKHRSHHAVPNSFPSIKYQPLCAPYIHHLIECQNRLRILMTVLCSSSYSIIYGYMSLSLMSVHEVQL